MPPPSSRRCAALPARALAVVVALLAAQPGAPAAAAAGLDRLLDEAASALHRGDDARAARLLERASAVGEGDPRVLLALARLGRIEDAARWFARAVALSPENADYRANLDKARAMLERQPQPRE